VTIRTLLLFTFLPIAAVVVHGESIWAYVPAHRPSSSVDGIAAEGPLSDNLIKYIGAVPNVERQNTRVVRVELPGIVNAVSRQPDLIGTTAPKLTTSALWPNADDKIAFVPRKAREISGVPKFRNPWEARTLQNVRSDPVVLSCGGIIVGGVGGDVAILNGRIVTSGDVIGAYRVSIIVPEGVVLDRDGSLFVIPLGRHITIETAGG
jgi:hypothetical protein